MPGIQSKMSRHAKQQKNTTHEKNQTEKDHTQQNSSDKIIKAVIMTVVHMFKKVNGKIKHAR